MKKLLALVLTVVMLLSMLSFATAEDSTLASVLGYVVSFFS